MSPVFQPSATHCRMTALFASPDMVGPPFRLSIESRHFGSGLGRAGGANSGPGIPARESRGGPRAGNEEGLARTLRTSGQDLDLDLGTNALGRPRQVRD